MTLIITFFILMLRPILFLFIKGIILSFGVARLIVREDTFPACLVAGFAAEFEDSTELAFLRSYSGLIDSSNFTKGSAAIQSFLTLA